ncbi:MAG: NUDIX domain-containing protein [Candidatus Bathyarchaeota archaeon]|nr:NUDIX domain-containing protein [Candidatus Bathyarchaeota archaeon]
MCGDERFCIVDENDNVIGWAYRSECHKKGLIHRSVYVIVLNNRGEVFIQRRSMSKDLYPGLYACSASGHVEYGESYEEAARRELMEELGINAQLKYIGKFKCFSKTEREFSALYLCHHNGPIKLNSEEISEGKFMSIEEIKRMLEYCGDKFALGSILALKEFIKYIEGEGC